MNNFQEKQQITVSDLGQTMRLDIFLSESLGITRSSAKRLIDDGFVIVNGKKPRKAGDTIHEGDIVDIEKTEQQASQTPKIKTEVRQIEAISVVAETNDYVVVNKPSGMLVHPTEAGEANTLADWIISQYPGLKKVGESSVRPGIMHRLDKEASGLLVVAKTQKMYLHLKHQFQQRTVDKLYSVLVYGAIECDHDVINFDIDRGRDGHMVARPKTDLLKLRNITKIQPGKQAVTEFWVEQSFTRFTLLNIKIHTGRTHQIRVHMFAYDHPVVGDTIYFNKKLIKKTEILLGRLFLHARELSFVDLEGNRKKFEADIPLVLQNYLLRLR